MSRYSSSRNAKYNKYKREQPDIYAADFETTTSKEDCRVWSAAIVKMHSREVVIYPDIEHFIYFVESLKRDTHIYFHNLKFDGSFIVLYLLNSSKYTSITGANCSNVKPGELKPGEYQYFISEMGLWYCIELRTENALITFRDSLKILPFTLEKLTNDFNVEHKKTKMEYHDKTSLADCTDSDIEYIKHDVLGLIECLEIFQESYGLDYLTIGSTALNYFKTQLKSTVDGKKMEHNIFVEHEKTVFNDDEYKELNFLIGVDKDKKYNKDLEQFLRRSYRGAFCYVNPKFQEKEIRSPITVYDVNSLYPSVMYSQRFPIGSPSKLTDYPENQFANCSIEFKKSIYFFIRLYINDVKLKDGYLPTFQIKDDLRFGANEWITEIDVSDGVLVTFTQTDYMLFRKHYECKTCYFIGGFYFQTNKKPIFKEYIDHFMQIKANETGAKRTIAKLFLNSLYGKFATKRTSNYKYLVKSETQPGRMVYKMGKEEKLRKSINIAIGSAITAYARYYTITHAQANIDRFAYADTDSLHLIGEPGDAIGIKVDSKKLGYWKEESVGMHLFCAKYLRQKTYVEIGAKSKNQIYHQGTKANHKKIGTVTSGSYHSLIINIVAAGLTPGGKKKVKSEIVKKGVDVFKMGLLIKNCKLMPWLTETGTVLIEGDFTIK